MASTKREKRIRRHIRGRARIYGTHVRPRLSVFRSHSHVWLQLVDDGARKTLISASDSELSKAKKGKKKEAPKTERAFAVGKLLAERAKEKKISHVVFDRGGYAYHGVVKMVADGAREGGLQF